MSSIIMSHLNAAVFSSLFNSFGSNGSDVAPDTVSPTDRSIATLFEKYLNKSSIPLKISLGVLPTSPPTYRTAVFLPQFNLGLLIEPNKSNFFVSSFICYLNNNICSTSYEVTIPSPYSSREVSYSNLSEWLSFLSSSLLHSWEPLEQTSCIRGRHVHESREPNDASFYCEYLLSLLHGTDISISNSFILKDRVLWNNQQFSWRRSGVYNVISQVITVIKGNRSWEGEFLKYCLGLFEKAEILSSDDVEFAVGELKLLGVDYIPTVWSVPPPAQIASSVQSNLIDLPVASVYVSFDFPSRFVFSKSISYVPPLDPPTTPKDPCLSPFQILQEKVGYINRRISQENVMHPMEFSLNLLIILENFKLIFEQVAYGFPRLLDYRLPFPFLNQFSFLQFVSLEERRRFNICREFLEELNKPNDLPSLLEMTRKNSFQVIEAQNNDKMIDFIKKSVAKDLANKNLKISEVEDLKKLQEIDRQSIINDCCSCSHVLDVFSSTYITVTCRKCKVELRMKNRRCGIFENSFPSSKILQLSVAFDVFLPELIAKLYNSYSLLCSVFYEFKQNRATFYRKWSKSGPRLFNERPDSLIYLESNKKSWVQSHYKTLHIDSSVENFTVQCGHSVILASTASGLGFIISQPLLPKIITIPPPPPYTSLQSFLTSSHTQNQVLASLHDCSTDLLLSQFHAFGLLRAGYNLSFSNTLSALITKVLDFNHPAVHQLLEAIWFEIGEYELRDVSHLDFRTRLCEEIIKFAKFYANNWDKPGLMYSVLIILDRISENYQEEIIKEAYDVIRSILDDWKSRCSDEYLPSICAYHLMAHKLFSTKLEILLHNLSIRNDWSKSISKQSIITTSTLKSFFIFSQNNFDFKINQAVKRALSPLFSFDLDSNLLNEFVFEMISVNLCSNHVFWYRNDNWYYCDYLGQRFEFNYCSGEFLIDRKSFKYLPSSIRNSENFEKIFGRNFNPEITVIHSGYRTRKTFNNFVYEFHEDFKIFQINPITNKKWLFSPSYPVNLPHSFSTFFHWFSEDFVLEFRREALDPDTCLYYLHPEIGRITVANDNNLYLVPVNSSIFVFFRDYFPLEEAQFIEIFVRKIDGNYVLSHINLPRFNLNFIEKNEQLFCETLQKFLSPYTSLSNLSILKSIILKDELTHYLVVPFGSVAARDVNISSKISSVKYFLYKYHAKFDLYFYQGRGNGWLYLTLLYAMFHTTKQGIHIALNLLQTVCFPSKKYNSQAINILDNIKELSPKRNYYPSHLKVMEMIEFPSDLNYLSSLDLYDILVSCLIALNDGNTSVSIDFLRLRGYYDTRHLFPKLLPFFESLLPHKIKTTFITLSTRKHNVWSIIPPAKVSSLHDLLTFSLPSTEQLDAFISQIRGFKWDTIVLDDPFLVVLAFSSKVDTPVLRRLVVKFLKYKLWNGGDRSFASSLLSYFLSSLHRQPLVLTAPPIPIDHFQSVDLVVDRALFIDGHLKKIYKKHNEQFQVLSTYKQSIENLHKQVVDYLRGGPCNDEYLPASFTYLDFNKNCNSKEIPKSVFNTTTEHPWCLTLYSVCDHLNFPEANSLTSLITILEDVLQLKVRDYQLRVARHMLDSPVSIQTQLHMGEGKSSVIIPIIVLGILLRKLIPRINVIRSQLVTCLSMYANTFSLMGIRLVVFSCNRQSISTAHDYANLLSISNVLICAPEDRQSFFLKSKQESLISPKFELIREVLDESDDQLDPKNQLVYPYGAPETVDGGNLRWIVGEAVLEALIHILQVSEGSFELQISCLDENIQKEILHYVLSGSSCLHRNCAFDFTIHEQSAISEFALYRNATFPRLSGSAAQLALLLRGYFLHGVINRALRLRYRVQFGLDSRRNPIAVPFRARDVPSLAAEFSDVDLVILLTLISFYHKGISSEQFETLLANLTTDKHLINVWTGGDFSFERLSLSDEQQHTILYRQLQYNFQTINYYLNLYVFPRFTRQFSRKRSASPWHLTMSKYPVTGFSGTNQSSSLLPFPMVQNDLDFVLETNTKLDEVLRNQSVVTCDGNVLSFLLAHPSIHVLLDVGAVVKLTNSEFSRAWLEQNKNPLITAVVYFENGDLVVFDGCFVHPFYDSPYSNQLNKCLVFLDDFHTRGTDLMFPANSIAALTLFRGLSRDRVAQGAMRLRLLMDSNPLLRQSVVFLKPLDVDFDCVVSWLNSNTEKMLDENRLSWTRQGISFVKDEEHDESQLLDHLYRPCPTVSTVGSLLKSSQLDPNSAIFAFMQRFATLSAHKSLTEEEQEKEQEDEEELQEEAEAQILRPNKRDPRSPRCSQIVLDLFEGKVSLSFKPLVKCLFGVDHTSCVASPEFLSIYEGQKGPLFNRPSSWVVLLGNIAVFITPFEANSLLNYYEIDSISARNYGLHAVIPRRSKDQSILPLYNGPCRWEGHGVLNLIIGSTYFADALAEEKFCNFFGLFPKPRSRDAELAKGRGFINDEGFGSIDRQSRRFPQSTVPVIKKFLSELFFDESFNGTPLHDVVFLMLKSKIYID
ncbi:hypothetical protein RCL1_004458 [Eukaryota sp. TZLM3-RCL]